MDILGRLLDRVLQRYGPDVTNEFLTWFGNSGHADVLLAPLLRDTPGQTQRFTRLDAVPLARTSRLDIANLADQPCRIGMRLDLLGAAPSVETLFDRFVHCCSHINSLGNFRNDISYYAQVYAGQRYLMSHGDGSCGSLGMMLQSLARRLLHEEITAHYVCTAKRELTHVYCTYAAPGIAEEQFLDADQKTRCPISKIKGIYPYGFLFQLLAVVGYETYRALPEDERNRLFFSMTHRGFENHRTAYHQASYQERPSVAMLSHLFAQAQADNHEILRIEADDFPWKAQMRAIAPADPRVGAYFLCHTEDFWTLEIPAGGRFAVGFACLPDEIIPIVQVFCNRVPGTLWLDLAAQREYCLDLPELPWLAVSDAPGAVRFNGRWLRPQPAAGGTPSWTFGAGELEPILKLDCPTCSLTISAETPCRLGLVLPINSLAINSGWVEFRQDRELDIAATLVGPNERNARI